MEYLSVRKDDKMLIIAPHPDDECIGTGGLLLQYADKCSIWVLTDGRIGQGDQNAELTREKRKNEFINEMQYLGIGSYCFFNIPDGTLAGHLDCLNDRDLSGFTRIFVTCGGDGHPDHTAAYLCVLNAIKAQDITPLLYEYEVHTHMEAPTHMLDITEIMERKKSLIRFHESQQAVFPYDYFAEITAKYRAMQCRQSEGYAEAYRLLKDSQGDRSEGSYETEIKLQKQIRYYQLLTKWMDKRNKGRSISDYFEKSLIRTIAVYGYAELGRLCVDELAKAKNITVSYVMDRKITAGEERIKVCKPAATNPSVDAVIVTAINSFDEIREELVLMGYKRIFSLEEVVDKI